MCLDLSDGTKQSVPMSMTVLPLGHTLDLFPIVFISHGCILCYLAVESSVDFTMDSCIFALSSEKDNRLKYQDKGKKILLVSLCFYEGSTPNKGEGKMLVTWGKELNIKLVQPVIKSLFEECCLIL